MLGLAQINYLKRNYIKAL